ncbi:MAG TPA: alpha/beta fold hydrolase, partial [Pyrinomonadaceae bacterium]
MMKMRAANDSRPRAINSRRIRVNDVELNIVIQGRGPDVLLVHGFPDDHTVWRNQIPALVDAGYRVIALDTRGCGESEIKPRKGDYAIASSWRTWLRYSTRSGSRRCGS